MTNKIDEQLSILVDDELTDHDAVLDRLSSDPALKARWSRYHLMRDVITGHMPDQPVSDIASRVSQALEKEPVILAPVHKRKRTKQLPFIMKQVGGLAIAATVSAVAVLTVQQTQDETSTTPTEIAAVQPQLQTQTQPQLQSQPPAQVRYVTDTSGLDTAVQSKLSGYLVNHNEYSVTGNMQGVLPYMRIVSETPGKVVVVRRANEQQ
jgi:negative regulator of sigma E activity